MTARKQKRRFLGVTLAMGFVLLLAASKTTSVLISPWLAHNARQVYAHQDVHGRWRCSGLNSKNDYTQLLCFLFLSDSIVEMEYERTRDINTYAEILMQRDGFLDTSDIEKELERGARFLVPPPIR